MIRGRTVSLHPFERRHLEGTRTWANDPELARLLDRARPISDLEHEEWFAQLHKLAHCLYFAIETNTEHRHIGNVWLWDLDPRHRRAELRILIGDHEHLGRGVGTEVISVLCNYAFDRLNLHKVYAYVLSINDRARRAFEKAGFVSEGTLREDRWVDGRYADVYVLGYIR